MKKIELIGYSSVITIQMLRKIRREGWDTVQLGLHRCPTAYWFGYLPNPADIPVIAWVIYLILSLCTFIWATCTIQYLYDRLCNFPLLTWRSTRVCCRFLHINKGRLHILAWVCLFLLGSTLSFFKMAAFVLENSKLNDIFIWFWFCSFLGLFVFFSFLFSFSHG